MLPFLQAPKMSTLLAIMIISFLSFEFSISAPSDGLPTNQKQIKKAFDNLIKLVEKNSSHKCLAKDSLIVQKQDEVKKLLKSFTKEGGLTDENMTKLLEQIDQFADLILESAKSTVTSMEPYNKTVELGRFDMNPNNLHSVTHNQMGINVTYYQLIFKSEHEEVVKAFVGRKKSDELLHNILKTANAPLFNRVHDKFSQVATLAVLINDVQKNRDEFFQNYVTSEDGYTFLRKETYAQMMDEITYRIGMLKEKPAGDVGVAYLLSVFCCPLYCSGAIKSFCFVPLCCSEDFGPRDVPDFDKEWGGALGWVATCCWAPTFGILAAPIFGIAAAGKACANISRRDHLEDKLAKLERLRNAEIKLNDENRN